MPIPRELAEEISESAIRWVAEKKLREQVQESASSSSSEPVEPSDQSLPLVEQERSPDSTQPD